MRARAQVYGHDGISFALLGLAVARAIAKARKNTSEITPEAVDVHAVPNDCPPER